MNTKRQILTAHQWEARMSRLQRMSARERREFERKRPAELSVMDLRDQAVGMVCARFRGSDDESFDECRQRGGPCPSTLRKWRDGKTQSPRMGTLRAALLTTGHDLRIVEVD